MPELLVRRLLRSMERLAALSARLLPAQYTCSQESSSEDTRASCVTTPPTGSTRWRNLRTVSRGDTERTPPLLRTGLGEEFSTTGTAARSGRWSRSSPHDGHCGRRIARCWVEGPYALTHIACSWIGAATRLTIQRATSMANRRRTASICGGNATRGATLRSPTCKRRKRSTSRLPLNRCTRQYQHGPPSAGRNTGPANGQTPAVATINQGLAEARCRRLVSSCAPSM